MKMDIQVQYRTKTLNQNDYPGLDILTDMARLVCQMSGDRPGDDSQYFAHQLWVGGKQKAQYSIQNRTDERTQN